MPHSIAGANSAVKPTAYGGGLPWPLGVANATSLPLHQNSKPSRKDHSMSVYVDRHNWDWKPVPGNVKKKPQACPRCNNQVQYFLAYDGDGWGFPGIWTFKLKQHYAFKCPICPNFEPLAKEEAKALLARGT